MKLIVKNQLSVSTLVHPTCVGEVWGASVCGQSESLRFWPFRLLYKVVQRVDITTS